MTLQILILLVLAFVTFIVGPIALVWTFIDGLRRKAGQKRSQEPFCDPLNHAPEASRSAEAGLSGFTRWASARDVLESRLRDDYLIAISANSSC